MIRMEYPKVDLDSVPEKEKVYALKKQLDGLIDNLQIVLDSIEEGGVTNIINNEGGGITSETDPIFTASPSHGITNADITNWNGKSTFSGSYTDLTNKPTIPSKTSDLTNDSGFISSGNISVLSGADTTGVSIASSGTLAKLADIATLTAGTWIVVCNVRFPATNATGTRGAKLYVNGSGDDSNTSYASDGGMNALQSYTLVLPIKSNSSTDIDLYARQSSGVAMSITYYWTAIKIA